MREVGAGRGRCGKRGLVEEGTGSGGNERKVREVGQRAEAAGSWTGSRRCGKWDMEQKVREVG